MERHTTNVVANILLIEDDDDLAELVQMHLKFQGASSQSRIQRCCGQKYLSAAVV